MKTNTNLILLLTIIFAATSCKKNNDMRINPDNLTACEAATTCSYLFTENADLNENNSLKEGSYRLFFAQTAYTSEVAMQRTLIIKAPMEGSNFQMDDNAIKNGAVIYKFVCPTCFAMNYKPIGGYLKGINITPGNSADQAKWLVEASIILATDDYSGAQSQRDIIYFKQYFLPNFISN